MGIALTVVSQIAINSLTIREPNRLSNFIYVKNTTS